MPLTPKEQLIAISQLEPCPTCGAEWFETRLGLEDADEAEGGLTMQHAEDCGLIAALTDDEILAAQ